MKIYLNEQNNVGLLENGEPFLLLDNKTMDIEFETNIVGVMLVRLKNGEAKKDIIIHDNTFTVPQELVKEGELDIVVTKYTGDKIGRKWYCEPITIIEVEEEKFEAFAKLDNLLEKVTVADECVNKVEAFEKQLNYRDIAIENKFKVQIQTLQKQIDELWQAVEQ